MGPRFLYLHGFGSGPRSKKGTHLFDTFAARGVPLELLDLRVPSFERLRLSAIIRTACDAIGGPGERAVLIGSSLGGLAAARAAERDPRICGLVLLAPAFRMAERWRRRLGPDRLRAWEETGWTPVHDYAANAPARVDHGFLTDAAEVDAGDGWPDVRVPTLVFHGRGDETVEVDSTRRWCHGRRHVRLIELDDGHELVPSLPQIAADTLAFLAPYGV